MWKRLQGHVREKEKHTQIGNPVLLETTYDQDQLHRNPNVTSLHSPEQQNYVLPPLDSLYVQLSLHPNPVLISLALAPNPHTTLPSLRLLERQSSLQSKDCRQCRLSLRSIRGPRLKTTITVILQPHYGPTTTIYPRQVHQSPKSSSRLLIRLSLSVTYPSATFPQWTTTNAKCKMSRATSRQFPCCVEHLPSSELAMCSLAPSKNSGKASLRQTAK